MRSFHSNLVGQVVNLRRIGNPPAGGLCESSGVLIESAGRIANPPQATSLPHKRGLT